MTAALCLIAGIALGVVGTLGLQRWATSSSPGPVAEERYDARLVTRARSVATPANRWEIEAAVEAYVSAWCADDSLPEPYQGELRRARAAAGDRLRAIAGGG